MAHYWRNPPNEVICTHCGNEVQNVPLYFANKWWHENCLKLAFLSRGECPKAGHGKLKSDGYCYVCGLNRLEILLKQAESDSAAILGQIKQTCEQCLHFNALTAAGLPFYPTDPQPADIQCKKCNKWVCFRHAANLPRKNILKLSSEDNYCTGYGSCFEEFEELVKCTFENCYTHSSSYRGREDEDPLVDFGHCEKCNVFWCKQDGHNQCPNCVGYPCEKCWEIFDRESLYEYHPDYYSVELLCEDCLSEQEFENEDKAWRLWAKREFIDEITKKFDIEDLWDEVDPTDDQIFELFRQLSDKSGVYWEHHGSEGPSIDFGRLLEDATLNDLHIVGIEEDSSDVESIETESDEPPAPPGLHFT